MKHSMILSLTFAVTASLCTIAVCGEKPGEQVEAKLTQDKLEIEYYFYLPKEYDKKKPAPLLFFLHGAGERGDDLSRVKIHGPPKLLAAGKHFPFIVVSPQCPSGKWWSSEDQVTALNTLLDSIIKEYKVDKDRIYVTGLSMGGFGTWALAAKSPDRFAAIAPICGGGKPETAKAIVHLPIWAFHGAKDSVVPLSSTQKIVDALKEIGGNPKLTIYPEANHDSWTETYDNPKLYEWLLQQKRTSKK